MSIQKSITDQFGRTHDYLRISLTEKCNLRCTYCMPAEGIPLLPRQHLMSADEIYKIAATFVGLGVRKIRLTGGEPFVRKDAPEILEKLASLGVELGISTNGILIDQHLALLHRLGIKNINISLDTLIPEKFKKITRRDEFERVYRNIQFFVKEEFNVKLNVVLMRGTNEDEVLNFVRLTSHLKVDVRFIEFMPFQGNQWESEKMVSLNEILSEVENHFPGKVITHENPKNATDKLFSISGFKGRFGVISTVTSHFCSGCNRMRLTADGKMKNCLFSNQEVDLLGTLRGGGSINPLIHQIMWKKKAVRAGMNTPEKFSDPNLNSDNRTMIAIGG